MKNTNEGFTLIEVLVGSLLILGIGVAFVGLNYIFTKNQTLIWQNYMNIEETNSNLLTLIREIRTSRQGDNGAYLLELARDQEIVFYSDIDFDGQTERVHYYLTGSDMFKGVIKPSGFPISYPQAQERLVKLTADVRNGSTSIFTYYNGSWPTDIVHNPLINPVKISDVRLVKVYLRLNTAINQPDKDFILQSYVDIRMLKDNL